MKPHFQHESANLTLAAIITIALEELNFDFVPRRLNNIQA
jgi:hypothetical protein